MRKQAVLALALPALLAARPAPPAADPAAVRDVTACRAITADAARLACFDRTAAALDTALAQHDVTVLDRQAVRETRRSLFGFSLPNLAPFGLADNGDAKSKEFTELDTTLTAVRSAGYARWDMTVAEGDAVWRNIDEIDVRPQIGQPVHIRKAALGSYFFRVASDRAFKAVRVR